MYRFRTARESDAADIVRVNTETWKSAYTGIVDRDFLETLDASDPHHIDRTRAAIRTGSVRYGVAAEVSGERERVVGMVRSGPARASESFEPRSGDYEICALYVLEDFAGRGIGEALVGFAVLGMPETAERLFITVLKDNPRRSFYERIGGAVFGEEHCVIGGKSYAVTRYVYNMTSLRTKYESLLRLSDWAADSKSIVFFGGAGVSTESGIPDFRSPQGIYNRPASAGIPAERMLSHSFFVEDPGTFYEFYGRRMLYLDAEPNAAHHVLARLERAGKLRAVVTQNIDGLHSKAGSERVFELHGSIHRNHCLRCGKSLNAAEMRALIDKSQQAGQIPRCACGGLVKPDVVLYEEALDHATMNGAVESIASADMLVVGGTSLSVYPAAGLIRYFRGDRLVLINKTPTDYDRFAGLVFHDSVSRIMRWLEFEFVR